MSNTDFDPSFVPDPTNVIGLAQRQALGAVATSIEDDPDKAARAKDIADTTGAPASVVYGDLDHHEAQLKASLSADLIRNNPQLQDYVNSHPLAAKVSNDDWGALDKASGSILRIGLAAATAGTSYPMTNSSVMGKFVEGFKAGADLPQLAQESQDLLNYIDSPVWRSFVMNSYLLPIGTGLKGSLQVLQGLSVGTALAGAELYKQMGGSETWGNRLARDALQIAQVALPELAHVPEISAAVDLSKQIKPWTDAGKVPPVGVHPVFDQLHAEQAKLDAESLSEALKDSVKSATRDRAPDLYAGFVKQHNDGEIGISADAVRELYGDKVPEADDGKLGFVPNIAEQLRAAEATGGDIKVPLADWLARVEPEVAKQLEDHIRVRPDGMTVEEAKEPPEHEAVATEPVGALRQAAGLTPVQERKLTLERGPDDETFRAGKGVTPTHTLVMKDPTGKEVGHLSVAEEDGGKRLYIDDIQSELGPQSLGPKAIRDVIEQIKEQFPNAEMLEGMRVSGAREKAEQVSGKERPAKELAASIDLTKIKPRAPKQLELPQEGTTRIEDREAFEKGAAIGMTADQYKRYQALIEKRAAEDAKRAESRAMEEQRKRLTPEWKANRAELRPQVREDLIARPDIELEEMLREGNVKLSTDTLSPKQIAALPKAYLAKDGIHPDDLSGLFGGVDHRQLVDGVIGLVQAREAAGMKPGAFLERLTDIETDRRMEEKYGSLDKNILEEAKDQVLSETQEDLLHEEVLARATEAGLEYSIGKEELKAAIKDFFDKQRVRDISTDKSLAESGRAARATEMALLKGDYAEAFRQKQRQYNAIVTANFAKQFEKDRARFEKLADRYDARELKAVEQEYTNWVRDILLRVGKLDGRKAQDLTSLIDNADSGIKSLAEFADYKEHHDLREVPIAEFLTDPNFKKNYEDLTAAEAKDVHDSVRALDKNGRDEKKYIRQGEAFDLAQLKTDLIDSLQRFKEKTYDTEGERAQAFSGVRKAIRTAMVAHLQVETVFNRLDRYDPKGPWNQFVFRPLVEAANHEALLERQFSKRLGAIADNVNMKESVPNPIFRNPFSDTPMAMNRKNLRAVLLNAGNESNLFKVAKGYDLEPAQVMDWLRQHATKQDWDWAQKVWDMLHELGQQSDVMYRNLTGVAPEKLQIKPVDTPHGTYPGGYYPLIRHELYGEDIKLAKNDLEGAGYIRATTAAGYTKKRTGAIYPLSLDLDALPNQIRQIIHDISFRPAIIEAGKVFYDNKIKNEFKKHLGAEYSDMFVPWLKDVANTQNYFTSKAAKMFSGFSDFMRQNAITTLVGLNPSTFLKHTPTAVASSIAEVGPARFLKAAQSLFSINEEFGESNWQFAMKHSEELQRRSRNWVETMGGGLRQVEGLTMGKAIAQHEYGAAVMHLRDVVTEVASKPVAMGDLVSAVPTWLARYTAEMEEHGVHGDAVYAANKAVRQAHGSSAITSRSLVARSRSLSWFTGFFTFFNDLLNRQVETVWRAGEIAGLVRDGQKGEAMAQATKVAGRLFAYVVVPAMIEELVSPLASEKNESWGMKAAKGLAFTLSSSWVGVRDIVSAALNGRDPSAGLLSTSYKSLTDMARDLHKVKPKVGNVLRHSATLAGMLTGVVPAQAGRSAAFLASNEKPKGPWGWLVGLRYGTLKNHSQTFDQYVKGK